MGSEELAGVAIERCPVCKGIFFDDEAELERLIGLEVGTGDTLAFSAISDLMDQVPALCPRCARDMVAYTGPAEVRIDRCEGCGGSFLDQGELATLQLHAS